MSDTQIIQFLDVRSLPEFSYTDPEGVAVIMPCTDQEAGHRTAEILQRRANMPCKILVVMDTLRQGFIKTLNDTFARITAKYIVYLAQDAWPGRDWLKCAHDTLEKSGKGLLAFNDGKWQGRIASFGMVRTSWVQALYNGHPFYPGYASHGADNELTVIARAQGMHVYNPECTLVEHDPEKDFGGSNPQDNALFKKRFLQGFDRLLPLDRLEPLALEYKVNWRPAASMLISACENSKQLNHLLGSFFRTNLQQPLELIIIDQGCKQKAEKISSGYASQALVRLVTANPQEPLTYTMSQAVTRSRRNYLFIVKNIIKCKPGAMSEALHCLADQEICAAGICQDIEKAQSDQDIDILVCRKQDVQQAGGVDPGSGGHYVDVFLTRLYKMSDRSKLCLQDAQNKDDRKLLDIRQWT